MATPVRRRAVPAASRTAAHDTQAPQNTADPEHGQTRGTRTSNVVQERTVTKGVKTQKHLSHTSEQMDPLPGSRVTEVAHPALVRVGVGTTINMENYESMRIDVHVTLPCHPDDIEDTYLKASEFVGEKLREEEELWTRG